MAVNGKKIGRPRNPKLWHKIACKNCGFVSEVQDCYVRIGKMKFCSRSCCNKGKNNGRWRGGINKLSQGYIKIYSPDHPHKDYKNQVFEHRLAMEKKIGRFLLVTEVVHHINEIKNDNRIENLMLFRSDKEHQAHHAKLRKHNSSL